MISFNVNLLTVVTQPCEIGINIFFCHCVWSSLYVSRQYGAFDKTELDVLQKAIVSSTKTMQFMGLLNQIMYQMTSFDWKNQQIFEAYY